jgi:predicted nucleotidyltransferase
MYKRGMVREVADQKVAIAALCRELGVERLYLFGSGASEARMADVHDLDFLVRFKPVDPGQYTHRYLSLAEKLEDLFKARVDLVEMDAIDNPYFRKAAEETRVAVYESV